MIDRLAYTKSRLFDLTDKLLLAKPTGEGVRSAEVVDAIVKDISSVPESELIELTRIGLMVMAGRVTTMNRSDRQQLDILEKKQSACICGFAASGRKRTLSNKPI